MLAQRLNFYYLYSSNLKFDGYVSTKYNENYSSECVCSNYITNIIYNFYMSNPIHVARANKFSCVWARSILLIFFFLPWGLINVFRPSCNYLLYCSLVWVRIYATHCVKGWFVIGLDHHVNIFYLLHKHKSEFIQHIVKEMMEKLSSKSLSITKRFIGIESTIAKLIPLFLLQFIYVRFDCKAWIFQTSTISDLNNGCN